VKRNASLLDHYRDSCAGIRTQAQDFDGAPVVEGLFVAGSQGVSLVEVREVTSVASSR